jgi:hypothetical protein
MIGAIGETRQQARKLTVDQWLGPVDRTESDAEVDHVNLDLAPPPVGQLRDGMFPTLDGTDWASPALVGKQLEASVEPL